MAAELTDLIPLPTFLTGDLIGLALLGLPPIWGIFFSGIPVVIADSIVEMEFKRNWSQSTYPIEQGGFQNYDKVANPASIQLILSKGGSASDRELFLDALNLVAGNLLLYDVITPDQVYLDYNIAQLDYRRTATQGNGLLQVAIQLLEIRESAQTDFTNTQSPASADTQSNGNTNPTAIDSQGLSPTT